MDDDTITVIEAVEPSLDWHSFFEEGLSKEELNTGTDVWKAGVEACTEMDLPEDLEIVGNSVYPELDKVMGAGWETFVRSALLCMLLDFQDSHAEDKEEESQIFFPEDILRVVYSMGKKLHEQKITIDSLQFALNHLENRV